MASWRMRLERGCTLIPGNSRECLLIARAPRRHSLSMECRESNWWRRMDDEAAWGRSGAPWEGDRSSRRLCGIVRPISMHKDVPSRSSGRRIRVCDWTEGLRTGEKERRGSEGRTRKMRKTCSHDPSMTHEMRSLEMMRIDRHDEGSLVWRRCG